MANSVIYVTASSKEEALRLARALVQDRLVACANVIDGATSVYWWEGEVRDAPEALMVAKTRTENVEAVIARVKAEHSYSCPCVVALPIEAGNPAYLDWIQAETLPR